MKRVVATAVLGVLLAGCASSAPPAPSVYVAPLKGRAGGQQLRDQNDCMLIAKGQTGYDPATETAKGAGVGALIGAVGGAAAGAAVGAAAGGAGQRPLPVQQEQGRLRAGVRQLHDRARLQRALRASERVALSGGATAAPGRPENGGLGARPEPPMYRVARAAQDASGVQ